MKKQHFICLSITCSCTLLGSAADATQVLLSEVPAYNWYHGCGPTAAASILGFYDLHGYDNLFIASGWDDVSLTANIKDEISSPEHNEKYDAHPDNSTLPAPPDTSIADFFHTSEGLSFGSSYLSYADDAFTGYASYKGYTDWSAWNLGFSAFSFNDLVSEINNNSPLMFLIDTNADNTTDHFVPVIGYDDVAMQYACYTTWSESETDSVMWNNYYGLGNSWGVGWVTLIRPGAQDAPAVPEPTTVLLFSTGIACLTAIRRKEANRFSGRKI